MAVSKQCHVKAVPCQTLRHDAVLQYSHYEPTFLLCSVKFIMKIVVLKNATFCCSVNIQRQQVPLKDWYVHTASHHSRQS